MQVIFMTSHPAAKGGIGNWVRILQAQINKYKEFNPVYIYPADFDENEKPVIEQSFIEHISRGIWLMFRAERQLIGCLRKNKVDRVIHLTCSGGLSVVRDLLYAVTARLYKTPLILHIRFGRIPILAESKSIEWSILKCVLSLASQVITIDQETYNALNHIIEKKKVHLIPNFIDIDSINKNNIIKSKEKMILFVGWVIKTKGVEELLEAWNQIQNRFPEYELVLAGPVTIDYQQILSKKFDLSKTILKGSMVHEDVMNLIQMSEVFVLPSYSEGFPNAVLEAMALGKPIIATNVGAIPEMLRGCGVLIHKESVDEIRDGLLSLMNNENERRLLGIAAQKKVQNYYSVPIVMKRYIQIWEDCLQQ